MTEFLLSIVLSVFRGCAWFISILKSAFCHGKEIKNTKEEISRLIERNKELDTLNKGFKPVPIQREIKDNNERIKTLTDTLNTLKNK